MVSSWAIFVRIEPLIVMLCRWLFGQWNWICRYTIGNCAAVDHIKPQNLNENATSNHSPNPAEVGLHICTHKACARWLIKYEIELHIVQQFAAAVHSVARINLLVCAKKWTNSLTSAGNCKLFFFARDERVTTKTNNLSFCDPCIRVHRRHNGIDEHCGQRGSRWLRMRRTGGAKKKKFKTKMEIEINFFNSLADKRRKWMDIVVIETRAH